MMNILQLGQLGRTLKCGYSNILRLNGIRNIYLHKGPRVAGLKKDPEAVFVTNSGYKYEKSPENLKYIKEFLNEEYAIPDDIALQVLTHKSFGNGIKPYNEKLSAMGSKLLNLFFAKFVTSQPTTNELAINGKNLDSLGSPMSKELSGRMSLGLFARKTKLNTVMFWKSYNHQLSFESSGEMKVSAQMMYALVGAVTFVHGKQIAEKFVTEKLLNNSSSLQEITEQVIQQEN